ncbi:MAG: ABC transporter permease [Bacteroidales bacterium]|nr:ABC transporter permease [Bacteroidales bacterium]
MNLPTHIARRYLFSRKLSLVNVISFIAILGVAGMSAALVVILSVFNGFDSIISSMVNQFDPDMKIAPVKGKTFTMTEDIRSQLYDIEGVEGVSFTVEETALFQYDNYQYIATIKGVDNSYAQVCDIPANVIIGEYLLQDTSGVPFAIVGSDIAANLWVQPNGLTPMKVYAPRSTAKVTTLPSEAFSSGFLMPSGVFHIHQDFDAKYVIAPLSFTKELLELKDDEFSAIEIRTNGDDDAIAARIRQLIGDRFTIKNRYQQQDTLYKIMQSEKLSIFVMLTFIIIIASFNIVGALAMLIIDKKGDIATLSHLGANNGFLRSIFVRTGQLITITGVVSGIAIGLLVCWLQLHFQLLTFPEGSYIIDAYPVEVRGFDVIATAVIVTAIGFLAALVPTRRLFAE